MTFMNNHLVVRSYSNVYQSIETDEFVFILFFSTEHSGIQRVNQSMASSNKLTQISTKHFF